MKTFLIISPNNYGNVGDDICAYSGQYLVNSILPKARTIITSPPFNESEASSADGFILSGGGPIYDRSEPNVENYMQYLDYGQAKDKLTAAIGVGEQGIVHEWGKKRYRTVLNRADLVTTRSQADKSALQDIGVKNVVATQDLGFLADQWVKRPWLKPRLKKSAKPRLGLVLMDVRFLQDYKNGDKHLRDYIATVEDNLEYLKQNFDVYLFAHSKDDEDWRNSMASKYDFKIVVYKNIEDFPKFFATYKQMDLVLGARFHAVILGLLAHKPVIGLGLPDAKLFKLAKSAPTLRRQSCSINDGKELSKLLSSLRTDYDQNKFKVLGSNELDKLKSAAALNQNLLRRII